MLVAFAFLSRLPMPTRITPDAADVGRATVFFPLVGATLGALLAVVGQGLAVILPPAVAAVLVVAAGTVVTGALHLDGLADTADGLGGGRTREAALRIMRDHAIGAYGAIALVLVLGLKIAAVTALITRPGCASALVIAATLARWAPVALGFFLPYARAEGGLGASVCEHVGWPEFFGASAIAAAVAGGLAGCRGAVLGLAALLVTALAGALCRRQLGGVTGDTLGAATEMVEAAVLVVALAST